MLRSLPAPTAMELIFFLAFALSWKLAVYYKRADVTHPVPCCDSSAKMQVLRMIFVFLCVTSCPLFGLSFTLSLTVYMCGKYSYQLPWKAKVKAKIANLTSWSRCVGQGVCWWVWSLFFWIATCSNCILLLASYFTWKTIDIVDVFISVLLDVNVRDTGMRVQTSLTPGFEGAKTRSTNDAKSGCAYFLQPGAPSIYDKVHSFLSRKIPASVFLPPLEVLRDEKRGNL